MTNITNNMKRKFLTVALTAAAFSVCAQAQEYLPEWQEGYLDIHTIATGRGDAALIVMPDGTTMMIDAGDNAKAKDTQHPDASKMPGEWPSISSIFCHSCRIRKTLTMPWLRICITTISEQPRT